MKILFYNWVDYLDPEARGGGISVYQRNLITSLAAQEGREPELRFLASGLSHDLRPGAPRWEPIRQGFSAKPDAGPAPPTHKTLRYEIVNAGVIAPSHADYGNPAQVTHPPTEAAFADFLRQTGPYDVIHFNALEGVPARVLAVADAHGARVVLSLHNYYPFCPQVNLWQAEAATCLDDRHGAACVTCLPHRADRRVLRLMHALGYTLKSRGIRPGSRVYDTVFWLARAVGWRNVRRLQRLRRRYAPRSTADAPAGITSRTQGSAGAAAAKARAFVARRTEMTALINAHVDVVLCVSDRVRQIAAARGIRPERLRTSYIGSDQAHYWHTTAPQETFLNPDGTLNLAYLGYMRRDKGFFFLLDALEALPDAQAARLHLSVAARAGPPEDRGMARLAALRPRLASLTHLDGYRRDTLDDLLRDTRLGVVPVLWEDNLPQVALEMHARHIPLLCSDRGGAQELGRCAALTFAAGDTAGFHTALKRVLSGAVSPAAYWAGAMPPVSMADHITELKAIFQPGQSLF